MLVLRRYTQNLTNLGRNRRRNKRLCGIYVIRILETFIILYDNHLTKTNLINIMKKI